MNIVVTGATGQLGRLVVEELLRTVPADRIAAVVRDPGRATGLAERGVEVRVADYDDPRSLRTAFRAGDVVLLISGSEVGRRVPQHTAAVEAAKAAGVARLAYTSVLGGPAADFDLAAEHQVTEQVILDSGLPYTFLRNGWYNENYTGQIATQLAHGVVGSAGDGRLGTAARADYAAAAAAVLTGEGHENQVYELSGDQAWTMAEYAAVLSERSGRDIGYTDLPPEAFRAVLTGAGLPEPLAAIFADVDAAVSRGRLAGGGDDLRRLIGRPTTPIADSIEQALKQALNDA